MKNQISTILMSFMLASALISCSPKPISVTNDLTKTPESVIEISTQTSTSQPTPTPPVDEMLAYYDGVIVLTQYYTFLGSGLHENAYDLLSFTAKSHYPSLDKYLEISRLSFLKVEIIQIVPYKDWAPLFGMKYSKDTENQKQFVVVMKAWGEGNMSGSAMNGQTQTLHIMLTLEDGQWKIDEFGGAVPFNP